MDPNKEAKVTIMPDGTNSIYRFWFQQNNTTSIGSTRIDVCDDPRNININCQANQTQITWHDEPIRINDGKTYLICDIKEIFGLQRKKQIILYLTKYKLDDMLDDNG